VLGRREDGRDRHRVQALHAQITNFTLLSVNM
jgi:hypothetical protein